MPEDKAACASMQNNGLNFDVQIKEPYSFTGKKGMCNTDYAFAIPYSPLVNSCFMKESNSVSSFLAENKDVLVVLFFCRASKR